MLHLTGHVKYSILSNGKEYKNRHFKNSMPIRKKNFNIGLIYINITILQN